MVNVPQYEMTRDRFNKIENMPYLSINGLDTTSLIYVKEEPSSGTTTIKLCKNNSARYFGGPHILNGVLLSGSYSSFDLDKATSKTVKYSYITRYMNVDIARFDTAYGTPGTYQIDFLADWDNSGHAVSSKGIGQIVIPENGYIPKPSNSSNPIKCITNTIAYHSGTPCYTYVRFDWRTLRKVA